MDAMIDKKRHIRRCSIFCTAVVFKLLLMGLFSSDYQDEMFIPFVSTFLSGADPYAYYFENRLLASFPYPPLMLFIETLGGSVLTLLDPSSLFLRNLIFKLPLLLFDLIAYGVIRRMNVPFKYAMIFYFCSPVILYATYMHGQLDIIPTALLLIAVYFLTDWKTQNNLLFSSLFLGLALSTKLHILAAVPVLFLYAATKKGFRSAAKYFLVSAALVALFCAGFMGQGFVETVLFNKEQSVLFSVALDYGSTRILLPILALILIYFKTFELNYFNKDLLISVLGLLFAVFLICIPPMPAWFTWIVPFVALYFGYVKTDKHKAMFVYMLYNLMYVVYFPFLHQTEFVDIRLLGRSLQAMKISNLHLKYAVFTVMVALLSMVIYHIYRSGVASNSLYRRGGLPFTIGIAGDSGTGKSRLLEKIERLFGAGQDVLFIEGDGDHRWARNSENWEKYTALDPKANYLYRQAGDIKELRNGNSVRRVEYDHDLGSFTETHRIYPKKYIVLCGLHSLYLPQLRKELDLKIFMDTDDELRKFWKIQRDTEKRGYSKERIIEQIEKRIPDAEKYIYPQKEFADMTIQYFDSTLKSCLEDEHEVILSLKLGIDINIDIEEIVQSFSEYGIHPQHNINGGFQKQEIIFDGAQLQNSVPYEELAERFIPQYKDLFACQPAWGQAVEGVIQLFLLILISEKIREQPYDKAGII